MKILFIRHGETTGDTEDRYGGAYDDHLSPKGVAQSEALAAMLRGSYVEKFYVSPLVRARETADILARALGSNVTIIPSFKERNQYGILTGKTKSEAALEHPDLVEALKDRMNTIEGAESYEACRERVQESFFSLVADAQNAKMNYIGVVWHGGPTRILFRDILKWGELKEIGDCCFVELDKEKGEWRYLRSHGLAFDFELRR